MPAVCGLCVNATKAIVWFKFSDTIWRSYKPNTFPFAYETVNNNDGTWTLIFRNQKVSPSGTYCPFFSAYDSNRKRYVQAGNTTVRFYGSPGDEELATFPSGSYNVWYMRGRIDACGNFGNWGVLGSQADPSIFSYSTQMTLEKTSFSNWVISKPTFYYANYYSSSATCNQCPSGWNQEMGRFTGNGQPQMQVLCNTDACPPDTACSCTKNKVTCCYNSNGDPVYSFKV
jgi:hypothetical protein